MGKIPHSPATDAPQRDKIGEIGDQSPEYVADWIRDAGESAEKKEKGGHAPEKIPENEGKVGSDEEIGVARAALRKKAMQEIADDVNRSVFEHIGTVSRRRELEMSVFGREI
jgi:hypothetical protein